MSFWDDIKTAFGGPLWDAASATIGGSTAGMVDVGGLAGGLANGDLGLGGIGSLSGLGDKILGKPPDPNFGPRSAIESVQRAYSGDAPSFFNQQLRDYNPITQERVSPAMIAYGAQGPSSGGGNPTVSADRLQRRVLEAPINLGYGRELNLQGMGSAPQAAVSRLGSAGTQNVATIGPAGDQRVSRLGNAGTQQVERLGRVGDQRVALAQTLGPAATERVAQMGPLGVERLNGADAAYQMLDPSTLGLDTAWRNGFGLSSDTTDAQRAAMARMGEVMAGNGWDPASEAQYQRQTAEAETRRRGNALAQVRAAEESGMAGSGVGLMAQLATGQDATQDQYLAALDAAALGAQRADQAAIASAGMGATLRGQEFGEAAQRAQAQDAWNQAMMAAQLQSSQVNTGRAFDAASQNAAAQNAASQTAYTTEAQRRAINAGAQNTASLQQNAQAQQTNLANAGARNTAYGAQYAAQQQRDMANAAAQNAAYAAQYGLQGQYNLANAAAQNAAYAAQYGLQGQYNLANAAANNNAYSNQYSAQQQRDLANAAAQNAAAQFNAQMQYGASQFNASAANQGALSNFNQRNAVDLYNNQNDWQRALTQFGHNTAVDAQNNANLMTIAMQNAQSQNQAAQFNAGQNFATQNANNQFAQQWNQMDAEQARSKLAETLGVAGVYGQQQGQGKPGFMDYVNAAFQPIGSLASTFGAMSGG